MLRVPNLCSLTQITYKKTCYTQGNCATKGNSGNCQSGNCHSGERWMRKPSVHGGKWKSNEGIDNIANGPVNNMSFFMLLSDRWYVFKHCGRPNHLSKCAWNLNCHCGRKACSSTSPHYGNCHYGTSHGGIISLCRPVIYENKPFSTKIKLFYVKTRLFFVKIMSFCPDTDVKISKVVFLNPNNL